MVNDAKLLYALLDASDVMLLYATRSKRAASPGKKTVDLEFLSRKRYDIGELTT